MANVIQHPIDIYPRPLSHSPSPFGFGFGSNSSSSNMAAVGWQLPSTPPGSQTNPVSFSQYSFPANLSPIRAQKRKYDVDDENNYKGQRDRSMERSPPPERIKLAAPKRIRVSPASDLRIRAETQLKGCKMNVFEGQAQDVDVGMLLASLPSQSLLPILNSLLSMQPSLKLDILSLIPRPTIETALHAVTEASRKLREAYPISNVPSVSSTSFGFGRGSGSQHPSAFGNSHNGMRESYILSRIRPHIAEFVSTCSSYLPYFSLAPISRSTHLSPEHSTLNSKGKAHPAETFMFLSAVVNSITSQAPLTQSSIEPFILPRLCEEWKAWVRKVDEIVNSEGGMFGSETASSWERGLDEMAKIKIGEDGDMMAVVRDLWVSKVGWMVGRVARWEE